jgi:O-methyltransferase involved in polyketide biosynthesis
MTERTTKDNDIKINLGEIQTTLLLPLYARARETEKKDPLVYDSFAKSILEKIDYDFSQFEKGQIENHQLIWALRAYNFDNTMKAFLETNKDAVVINIGAGLDTTFRRVDNGNVIWINIDLPDVAALRQKLIPDTEREMTIAQSVFDFTWIDDIAQHTTGRTIMIMAAGVLFYFERSDVKTLFCTLAERYPSAHVVFDAMSWFAVWASNLTIMRKSGMDSSARLKWHLRNASHLCEWVHTIRIIEEYPIFSRVEIRDDWDKNVIRDLKIANVLHLTNLYKMVLVQL